MSKPSHGLLAVPLHALAIAIVINVLWGGNPVAIKFSLWVFPPLWTGFFRFLIATVCLVAFARVSHFGPELSKTLPQFPILRSSASVRTPQALGLGLKFVHDIPYRPQRVHIEPAQKAILYGVRGSARHVHHITKRKRIDRLEHLARHVTRNGQTSVSDRLAPSEQSVGPDG